jgi:hypothetical protein
MTVLAESPSISTMKVLSISASGGGPADADPALAGVDVTADDGSPPDDEVASCRCAHHRFGAGAGGTTF